MQRKKEESDFILITNKKTTSKEITDWMDLCKDFGGSLRILDFSLYGSSTPIANAENKVIIIASNVMTDQKIDKSDIHLAAKEHNTSTYMIGGDCNLKEFILPLKSEKPKEEKVYKSLWMLTSPKENHLKQEAMKIKKARELEHPDKQFMVFYDYEAKNIPKDFFSGTTLWNLGSIQCVNATNVSQAHIAHRSVGKFHTMKIDVYNVAKLLPFQKKLHYFFKSKFETRGMIKLAILSDLAYELISFSKIKWRKDIGEKLLSQLPNLEAFSSYKHSHYKPTDFLNLLLRLEYFAMNLPASYEKMASIFFRAQLKNTALSVVSALLAKYFPEGYQLERRSCLNEILLDIKYNYEIEIPSKENIFQYFIDPLRQGKIFDNQIEFDEPLKLPSGKNS